MKNGDLEKRIKELEQRVQHLELLVGNLNKPPIKIIGRDLDGAPLIKPIIQSREGN